MARPRTESIELVRRRVSLHISTEASHTTHASEGDWADRCVREWDVIDGAEDRDEDGDRWGQKAGAGERHRGGRRDRTRDEERGRPEGQERESDDSTGVQWLRRWKP